MSSSVAKLKDAINEVRLDPAAIQRKVFDTLEEVGGGELDVVDPTNPFVFLLEASSVLTSAQMDEAENLTRRLYPSMALTEDELYLHMSDRDYVDRFSSPARTTFTLLFNKEELLQRAVKEETSDVRKLVVPRNTEFQVSDYVFTMEYPIELRVMSHGGLQVVYDVTQPSPLQTLESNVVEWEVVRLKGEEFIRLVVPVNQFKVSPHYAHINRSTNYTKTFTLEDDFYHCRVYRALSQGRWAEIRTTHTDQVFDPNTPTALLKVRTGQLQVTVPQVYISNGRLDKELRVDIYTTKGKLDLILDSYEINAFSANWRDIAKQDSQFSSPLSVFTTMAVYSDDVVVGGTKGLTFEELRARVIDNALGNVQLPITDAQLSARLSNMGYRAVKDVDNVTNRIYLATRRLPAPSNGRTQSGAVCTIGKLQYTFSELVRYRGVINNGARLTITPDVLFHRENGVVQFLPNNVRDNLRQLPNDALVSEVNALQSIVTPFHYVLDSNNELFNARAYYLDAPKIVQREYVEENRSFSLELTTRNVSVSKADQGYVLRVDVESGERLRLLDDDALVPQLSYRPPGEQRDVFLNGTLRGRKDDRWSFTFDVGSNFDVTTDHHLLTTAFTMYADEVKDYRADLTTSFNLVFYAKDSLALDAPEELRYRGGEFMVGQDYTGVSHEILKMEFGNHLEGFWENSRTVLESASYLRHEEDINATYEETVFKRDPVTGTVEVKLGDDGEVAYEVLHYKGDPMFNSEGNPVIKYHAGDPVLDENGDPILERDRELLREWDMFLYDGRYHYATRKSDVAYRDEIPQTVVRWLQSDLETFRGWALEQTDIFFFPQRTLGGVDALVGEGETRRVELEQAFKVTYYLTREKYDDPFVRDTLTELAKATIAEELTQQQIKRNKVISKLTAQAGEDIIAVNVSGLGGDADLDTLSLQRDIERCSIRKRLELNLDGELEIVDDVSVTFVRHTDD